MGYYGKAARRKPLLRLANIKHGTIWVSEMMERHLAFWSTVILSDESQFKLFTDSRRLWVWRLCHQEPKMQPTVKHGNIFVMVWSVFLTDGRSKLIECQGNINLSKYVSILKEEFFPIFCSDRMRKRQLIIYKRWSLSHC